MLTTRKRKVILIILLFVFAVLISVTLSGSRAYADSDDSPAYAYANSSIAIDVNENKILHVKENLNVGFRRRVEHVTRRIPAKTASYKNKNGKLVKGSSFLAKLSNISATVGGNQANADYDKNGTCYYLRIHNPNGYFSLWDKESDIKYAVTLEYDFDLSDDVTGANSLVFPFFDEYDPLWFYYNDDHSNIAKLSVTVNMPKSFDGEKAGVYYGSTDKSADLALEVSGNTVTFSVPIKNTSNYTLQMPLSDGYFITQVTYYPYYWLFFGAIFVLIAISIGMVFAFRGRKPVCPVEYEPPVINPMHYSAYWHGYPHRKDVGTIILHWARQGCVKISKDGKKDLILTKLKPLPENSAGAEKRYFNCLFKYGNEYRSKDTRGFQNLNRKNEIRKKVADLIRESEKPMPFVSGVDWTRMFLVVICIVIYAILFAYFMTLSGDWIFMLALSMFLFIGIVPLVKLSPSFREMDKMKQRDPRQYKIMRVLSLVAFIPLAFFFWVFVSTQYMGVYDYAHITLIVAIWTILCLFVLPLFLKKRKAEAQQLYGRMLGFKKFITLAKLPEMERILQDNPDYYFDVLPYCMIMGLSKKLDKQMQNLRVAVPDWAEGFEAAYFAEELFYTVKHAMITRKKNQPRNEHALDN